MAKIVAIITSIRLEVEMVENLNELSTRKSRLITLYDLKPTDRIDVRFYKQPEVSILRGKNLSLLISFDVDMVFQRSMGQLVPITSNKLI